MIHVFHGFLGSPSDFSFIPNENIAFHDLYCLKDSVTISPDDSLIGYSMGGRVALDIADKNDFKIKKLVLINAHPGLESDEDKTSRQEFENKVLEMLKTCNQLEFLEWWNNLPIFTHDKPLSITDENRFLEAPTLFQKYRLSHQKNYLPLMEKYKDKILFIAGLFDEKYMDLVSEMLLPLEIKVRGIPGGHRLYQEEKELLKILTEENIL